MHKQPATERIKDQGIFIPLEALNGEPEQVRLRLGHIAGVAVSLGAMYGPNGELLGAAISKVNERPKNDDSETTAVSFYHVPLEDPKLHTPFTIGRAFKDNQNDMQISAHGMGGHVSRNHLSVQWADTMHGYGLWIKDHSSNGTRIEKGPVLHMGEQTLEREPWPKTEYGVGQIAKKSLLDRTDRKPSYDLKAGDDTALTVPSRGLYGVLDGVGGHANGAKASQGAVKFLRERVLKDRRPATVQDAAWNLQRDLYEAHIRAVRDPEVGLTTATVLQMMPELRQDGRREVAWASVGDSRLYYYDAAAGTVAQLSQDEGEANILYSAIGGKNASINQYGCFAGKPGDKLIVVSDGITGDCGEEIMHPGEIAEIIYNSAGPEDAARLLMRRARKIDDRTAVVVEIPGSR